MIPAKVAAACMPPGDGDGDGGEGGQRPSVGRAEDNSVRFELACIRRGFPRSVTRMDMISCLLSCSAFVVLLSGVFKW